MPIDHKCICWVINMSHIASSQDYGQHDLQTLLYFDKYACDIVQSVQTSKSWLKMPKQQRKWTWIRSSYMSITKPNLWSERKQCTIERSCWRILSNMVWIRRRHYYHTCRGFPKTLMMNVLFRLTHNRSIRPHVFITYPNVHNDHNLTIIVIQRVLMCWGHPFPPILFIQLDSTARENKNSIVFGYLSMLVI